MKEKVQIGYIGLGRRGMGLLKHCFSQVRDVEIVGDYDKSKQENTVWMKCV